MCYKHGFPVIYKKINKLSRSTWPSFVAKEIIHSHSKSFRIFPLSFPLLLPPRQAFSLATQLSIKPTWRKRGTLLSAKWSDSPFDTRLQSRQSITIYAFEGQFRVAFCTPFWIDPQIIRANARFLFNLSLMISRRYTKRRINLSLPVNRIGPFVRYSSRVYSVNENG